MKELENFRKFLVEETKSLNENEKILDEVLFPDSINVNTRIELISNTNNPTNYLEPGVYKSTGREFDGMRIYKNIKTGSKYYLHPEDMDMIKKK
jgi:hypothetical protein